MLLVAVPEWSWSVQRSGDCCCSNCCCYCSVHSQLGQRWWPPEDSEQRWRSTREPRRLWEIAGKDSRHSCRIHCSHRLSSGGKSQYWNLHSGYTGRSFGAWTRTDVDLHNILAPIWGCNSLRLGCWIMFFYFKRVTVLKKRISPLQLLIKRPSITTTLMASSWSWSNILSFQELITVTLVPLRPFLLKSIATLNKYLTELWLLDGGYWTPAVITLDSANDRQSDDNDKCGHSGRTNTFLCGWPCSAVWIHLIWGSAISFSVTGQPWIHISLAWVMIHVPVLENK